MVEESKALAISDSDSELSASLAKFENVQQPFGSKNFSESDLPVEVLYMKIDNLEQSKADLQDDLEAAKIRARTLLMRKELEERRLKQIIGRLESFLKNGGDFQLPLSQDKINQIGQLTDDEIMENLDLERELEEAENPSVNMPPQTEVE